MIIIILRDSEYIMSYFNLAVEFEGHLMMVTNKHRVKPLPSYGNLEICKEKNIQPFKNPPVFIL